MATKVWRQGDVWIYKISEQQFRDTYKHPIHRDPKHGIVLAEGEVTGHHHKIKHGGRLYEVDRDPNVRLMSASGPVSLQHEEHETIELPAGKYEVRIQREYAPEAPARQTRVYD